MLDNTRKAKLLSLDLESLEVLRDILSQKYNKETGKITPPLYPCTEEMILEKDELFNKKKITTTVGRYLFNRLVLGPDILKFIGYKNIVITDSAYKKDIDGEITILLREDKITSKQFMSYVNRLENFSTALIASLTNSFTKKVLIPNEKVIKRKKELFKEHKKELEAGNTLVAVQIEKELVDLAKKELEGDPGLDSYNSGARGSFASNYKEIAIMKGPVLNSDTGKWEIIENSFEEGLSKKDLPTHGNSIVDGAYPKAVGTATSGHFSKQIMNALETQVLDDIENSFCGTKKTIQIVIEKSIKSEFIGRTILDGSKRVKLTFDNIDKYVDKSVQLYSPMACLKVNGGKICSVCGDSSVLAQGTTHIGIASTRLSSTTLNMKMKQFHSATVKITKLKKENMFLKS